MTSHDRLTCMTVYALQEFLQMAGDSFADWTGRLEPVLRGLADRVPQPQIAHSAREGDSRD